MLIVGKIARHDGVKTRAQVCKACGHSKMVWDWFVVIIYSYILIEWYIDISKFEICTENIIWDITTSNFKYLDTKFTIILFVINYYFYYILINLKQFYKCTGNILPDAKFH